MLRVMFFLNVMFFSIITNAQVNNKAFVEIKFLSYHFFTPLYFLKANSDNQKWICTLAGAGMNSQCWEVKKKKGDN
jgi:hypothetical protein